MSYIHNLRAHYFSAIINRSRRGTIRCIQITYSEKNRQTILKGHLNQYTVGANVDYNSTKTSVVLISKKGQ